MKGSIRKQSPTSWQVVIDMGKDPNGQRRRHFETVKSPRKGDAQKCLTELLSQFEKGVYATSGRLTVGEHLNNWLAGYAETRCSPRTVESYRSMATHHLIPTLGSLPLKQLQPQQIQECYAGIVKKGLSSRTAQCAHRVLSQALKYGVRQGVLGRNVCELVDAPRLKKRPIRTLTPAEVEILLTAASDSPYYPVIYTGLNTGMRQAELLGLRWRDVDLDLLSLSVSQVYYKRRGIATFKEPKTTGSRRRIDLTPKLAMFLRQYQQERDDIGKRLVDLDALVFASPEGAPLDPSTLTHSLSRIAASAGLAGLRFHDLRHTCASILLLAGVHPKIVSEMLGHASVAFTLDTYSHIIGNMQQEAMALLNDIMPDGMSKTKCRGNVAEWDANNIQMS